MAFWQASRSDLLSRVVALETRAEVHEKRSDERHDETLDRIAVIHADVGTVFSRLDTMGTKIWVILLSGVGSVAAILAEVLLRHLPAL